LNSGIRKKNIGRGKEWFVVTLETAINAIKAAKDNFIALSSTQLISKHDTIEFRPEQKEAIEETIKKFKTKDRMLWNAKMRFGKTLSTLEVIRRGKFRKTIIITHRPVVKESWREDFYKIFTEDDGYYFCAKDTEGRDDTHLLEVCLKDDKPFVYFASIQDLRGSDLIGGNFSKNALIFDINWDLFVIDEAHEGTLTNLGDEVKKAIIKKNTYGKTKVLELSGTPFNLMDDFASDQIYTWDYVMEQKAKDEWNKLHDLDSNPYEGLPKLSIFTYDLGTVIPGYIETEDKAFNFTEFFRTWTGLIIDDRRAMPEDAHIGDFVHQKSVTSFISLITKKDEDSNYPFSKEGE
jgi:hypothetical protein